MSWAEVKTINSDLSKPLNELFEDSFRFFSTSDNLDVLEVVPDNETTELISNGGKEIFRKTSQYGGTLRLGVTIYEKYINNAIFRVYINSDLVLEMSNGENGGSSVRVYSPVFEVNKGDTVSLVIGRNSTPNNTMTAKNIYFLGRIGLGGSAFENE